MGIGRGLNGEGSAIGIRTSQKLPTSPKALSSRQPPAIVLICMVDYGEGSFVITLRPVASLLIQ